jgi:hypothetical protein
VAGAPVGIRIQSFPSKRKVPCQAEHFPFVVTGHVASHAPGNDIDGLLALVLVDDFLHDFGNTFRYLDDNDPDIHAILLCVRQA